MAGKLSELLNRKERENPRVTAYVSPDMFQQFKIFCKSHDITMSQCIEAMIHDLLATQQAKIVPISRPASKLGNGDDE